MFIVWGDLTRRQVFSCRLSFLLRVVPFSGLDIVILKFHMTFVPPPKS